MPGQPNASQMMNAAGFEPDFSNQYNTPLPPELQPAYMRWAYMNGQDPIKGKYDYDLQGAFLAGSGQANNGHFPDTFKKPNHPTFSDESQYNGLNGYVGGTWGKNGFVPSQTNLSFRSASALKKYFDKVEPTTPLLQSPPVPVPVNGKSSLSVADLMNYGLQFSALAGK